MEQNNTKKKEKRKYKKYEPRQPRYAKHHNINVRRQVGYYEYLRYYISHYPQEERRSISEFRSILAGYSLFLRNKILDGYTVELPLGMGYLGVAGYKSKVPKAIDWIETTKLYERDPKAKEEKKRVYYLNQHTEGILYKIKWHKILVKNYQIDYYIFIPSRPFKKEVSKRIFDGQTYLISHNQMIR